MEIAPKATRTICFCLLNHQQVSDITSSSIAYGRYVYFIAFVAYWCLTLSNGRKWLLPVYVLGMSIDRTNSLIKRKICALYVVDMLVLTIYICLMFIVCIELTIHFCNIDYCFFMVLAIW